MTTTTVARIESIERSVVTERDRAAWAAVRMLCCAAVAIFTIIVAVVWGQDMSVVPGLLNLIGAAMLVLAAGLNLRVLVSSKLVHAELVAELTRLRTLRDKGY